MQMRQVQAVTLPRADRAPGFRYRPVPFDSISSAAALAAITGEDNHFWEHRGIDYLAILKALGYRRARFDWRVERDRAALYRALGRAWERRDELRGASTISQQLAKNLYLSPSRNPLRKVKEAVTTWRLESALGKRRILELYLNIAEMGPGIWGVEAASQAYFRKPAARLNRVEAAALAGLLPFPLRSNPAYRPGRMRWRQNLILRRMAGETLEVPQTEEEVPDSVE
jgi:monofunctional biosynthetic peptidoglycan transglycosylase